MNKYTLKFKNRELEEQFGRYVIVESQARVLFLIIIITIVGFIAAIFQYIDGNIIVGSILLVWSVMTTLSYWQIKKHQQLTTYAQGLLTVTTLILPYFIYFFVIDFGSSLAEQICSLLIANLSSVYYQNYLLNIMIYMHWVIWNYFILNKILGFHYYELLLCMYAMFWMQIEHQRLYEKRRLFQESQINKSMWDIIDNKVHDKLVIFNYDEDKVKYNLEICNQAATDYLEANEGTGSLLTLLSQFKMVILHKSMTLSEYITQEYIYNKSILPLQKLHGYYQNRKQKVIVELYIQTIPKLKFIMNIQPLDTEQQISLTQLNFLRNYQVLTSRVLSDVYVCIRNQCHIEQMKNILSNYQLRLQIQVIKHSETLKYSISQFDAAYTIRKILNQENSKYKMIPACYPIQSDISLFKLVTRLIIKYFNQLQVQSQNYLVIEFQMNSIYLVITFAKQQNKIKSSQMDKFRYCIECLARLIGNCDSLIVTNNFIELHVLKALEPKFQYND